LKALGSLATLERAVMLGTVFYQFPLEIGTPVSIAASVTGIGSFASNSTDLKEDQTTFSKDSSLRLQYLTLNDITIKYLIFTRMLKFLIC